MTALIVCGSVLILLATAIISYFKMKYRYWEWKRIPSLEAHIPFGTMLNPLSDKVSLQQLLQEQYNTCKRRGYKYVGLYVFTSPQLLVIDPEIIRRILAKDFNHFTERGLYHEEQDPLSMHLFSLDTARWKKLRPKLTPTFSSGKMKMMFDIVVACGAQLTKSMGDICSKGPIDIKQILECYTMDVIGSCAFGIECNSFTDPSSDFCKYSKKIFTPTRLENIIGLFVNIFPGIAKIIRLRGIPKDITEFFFNIVKRSVQHRQETGLTRNDFLQILMELADAEVTKDPISFNEMVAQVFVFFIAGFETSSTTMAFCLLELSLNQSIQEKLREEVISTLAKHNGLTYESLKQMKYMDAVIDETLRKYPPVPVLNRECIEDYNLPDCDITIRKGDKIAIPLMGLHHDPDFFPEPDKFDPDRGPSPPYTHMPFGEGPRACIGIRFGMMQTKVGLVMLLRQYQFTISEKMATPVRFKARSFMTTAEGGVWLNAIRI